MDDENRLGPSPVLWFCGGSEALSTPPSARPMCAIETPASSVAVGRSDDQSRALMAIALPLPPIALRNRHDSPPCLHNDAALRGHGGGGRGGKV